MKIIKKDTAGNTITEKDIAALVLKTSECQRIISQAIGKQNDE